MTNNRVALNTFLMSLTDPPRPPPLRQEKHLAVVEHLISALNIFLRSAAMNCRMRVCGLGEELLPSVLYVWADMRPSAALKDEIVDFFYLQLCVHHPDGAKTPETGTVLTV